MNPIDLALLVFFLPHAVILWAGRTRGRAWMGTWLVTVAALLVPVMEDGFLATWLALAPPSVDPHGVAGTVEPHAAGHMFGAGIATILLGAVAVVLAQGPLRRGERWAWRTLAVVGVVVVGVGFVHLTVFYPHGLPSAAGGGGFGWPVWIAGFLAWGLGVGWGRPAGG